MKRRIVITGIGMITPLGNDAAATWSAVCAGRSGIAPIAHFDATGYPSRIAGEVRDFDPKLHLTAKEALHTDPFIQYAVAAAQSAMNDAALMLAPNTALRAGVLIGSGRGGVTTLERNMAALIARGSRAVSPFFAPMSLVSMASGYVAMKLGAKGPCLDVSTACATGTHALGEAMQIIRRGDADVMIAGGAEAAITPLVLAGFCQAKALSTRNNDPTAASRPFDANRDGFILSEGAGVLVLEERAHAERRGARIYAELAGYGLSADAYHPTRPDPDGDGAYRAIRAALADAHLPPDAIGAVNAHGTSTQANDAVETSAIKRAFGSHAKRLMISASKSMLGHMLGAAGAVEAALTALSLRHRFIPPTINYQTPDAACDLDYVPNTGRSIAVEAAVSNSFGFGGINACLVIRRYGEDIGHAT